MRILHFVVLLIGASALLSACAPPPRPAEFSTITKLMQDKLAADQAAKAAPQLFQLSQRFYKMAEDDYNSHHMDDCVHHSLLASTKFSTALERSRRLAADDRRAQAEQRLAKAQKVFAQQISRRSDAEARSKRMEQILTLREKLDQEQAASKVERARVAAELEKAKAEADANLKAEQQAAAERLAAEQALLEQSKLEKEAQQQEASASSKIQMAESLEANEFDPNDLGIAKTFMEQAGKAMSEKRFQAARDLAKNADDKAAAAIAKSQELYSQKKEKMKLLEERKALFTAAGALGAPAKQDQRGVVVTLYDMFASGKNVVLPERTYLLDQIAELATKYKDYPLVIEGYTDSMGRDPDNMALSQGRAQAVLDYLVAQKKIEFNRARASGYGSSNPVADNSTADGRSKNRRVEVIFLFR